MKNPWPDTVKPHVGFGHISHPITGKVTTHNGVDVFLKVRTPVVACADGVVVENTSYTGRGYTLTFRHDGDVFSVYDHLFLPPKLDVGDSVTEGEVVALSGKSGRITGPGLHFGMRVGGEWVDPMKMLEANNV